MIHAWESPLVENECASRGGGRVVRKKNPRALSYAEVTPPGVGAVQETCRC
jgi:hypothetical protein